MIGHTDNIGVTIFGEDKHISLREIKMSYLLTVYCLCYYIVSILQIKR